MKDFYLNIIFLVPFIAAVHYDPILPGVYDWKAPNKKISKAISSSVLFEGNGSKMNWLQVTSNELKLQSRYAGIKLKRSGHVWRVIIPGTFKEGHDRHVARVTGKFLNYIKNKDMRASEVPNMLAKYFITAKALEIASKSKQ